MVRVSKLGGLGGEVTCLGSHGTSDDRVELARPARRVDNAETLHATDKGRMTVYL